MERNIGRPRIENVENASRWTRWRRAEKERLNQSRNEDDDIEHLCSHVVNDDTKDDDTNDFDSRNNGCYLQNLSDSDTCPESSSDSESEENPITNDSGHHSNLNDVTDDFTDLLNLNDLNDPSQDNPTNFQPPSETNSTQLTSRLNSVLIENSKDDFKKSICDDLANFSIKHQITNSAFGDLLKIFDKTINGLKDDVINDFPNTNHLFKKYVNRRELTKTFSFVSPCCGTIIRDFKNLNSVDCECNTGIPVQEAILSRNYFFRYKMSQQIKILIEMFGLIEPVSDPININSEFDSLTYQEYTNYRPRHSIVTLKVYLDGASLYRSGNQQVWPIFCYLNELNCQSSKRMFMNACWYGFGKPDVEFFLRELITELLTLYEDGLFIKELGKKIYVMLFNCSIDAGARYHFLNHSYINASCGCTKCYSIGYRPPDHTRNHLYEAKLARPRTKQESINIYDSIESGQVEAPCLGIKGRCIFSILPYFNWIKCINVEPMHCLFAGVFKRMFESMRSADNSSKDCHLVKSKRDLIDSRIKEIDINGAFKRDLEIFSKSSEYKCNQMFNFVFYIAPIVFKSILKRSVYNHFFLLIYSLHKLWQGGFPRSHLPFYKQCMIDYVANVKQLYTELDLIYNTHQLIHLPDSVDNLGPLKNTNTFPSESENKEIKRFVKNPFGVLEQLASNYDMKFLNSICNVPKDVQFIPVGKPNDRNHFKKIRKNRLEIKSYYNNKKVKKVNHYIETISGHFFKVLYFVQDHSEVYAICLAIKRINKVSVSRERVPLELDYMYNAELTDRQVKFPINEIKDLVLFVAKFVDQSKDFVKDNTGYIIKTNYLTCHN